MKKRATYIMASASASATRIGSRNSQQAGLPEINVILGRSNAGPQVSVVGVNPEKITCDELIVGHRASFDGVIIRANFAAGSRANPTITFVGTSAGFYAAGGSLHVVNSGALIASFAPDAFQLTNIASPSGIIDFHGATLVNVSGIVVKPGAYDIIGDPVTGSGADDIEVLDIPLAVTSGMSGTWEFNVSVIFALRGSNGAISGSISFRARVYIASAAPTVVNITNGRYVTSQYCDEQLADTNARIVTRASGARIIANGIAGVEIVWQAQCGVMMVQS
jgi:hypothetical protein